MTVIAVNGAIGHLPRADLWFTLDPSPENRAIMASPVDGVTYYAAVPDDYGTEAAESPAMRLAPDLHVRHLKRITGAGHGRYRTRGGLPAWRGAVHTGNSGWGALQVGAHLRPERIALFGIDGAGGYLGGDGVPKHLAMMPPLFASAVGGLRDRRIAVRNGSPASLVTCFRRSTPEEARAWLEG